SEREVVLDCCLGVCEKGDEESIPIGEVRGAKNGDARSSHRDETACCQQGGQFRDRLVRRQSQRTSSDPGIPLHRTRQQTDVSRSLRDGSRQVLKDSGDSSATRRRRASPHAPTSFPMLLRTRSRSRGMVSKWVLVPPPSMISRSIWRTV